MSNGNNIIIAPSGLMDIKNAAKYLGVTIRTMRTLRTQRQLKFVTIAGRLMVRQATIDAYIRRQEDI